MRISRLGNGILTTGPMEEKLHFVFITKSGEIVGKNRSS